MAKEQLWQEDCAGKLFTWDVKIKEMVRSQHQAHRPSGVPLHDVLFVWSVTITKLVIVNVSLHLGDYVPQYTSLPCQTCCLSNAIILADPSIIHHFESALAVVTGTTLHISAHVKANVLGQQPQAAS